jgi:hypothetical protein
VHLSADLQRTRRHDPESQCTMVQGETLRCNTESRLKLSHRKRPFQVVHFANSVDSTSKKLHILPPRTIGNWCVTGRTVGDRRTPKVLQGLESNPPSGRSSRNGEAANVNGWSVISSLAHVLGTTSTFTFCLGKGVVSASHRSRLSVASIPSMLPRPMFLRLFCITVLLRKRHHLILVAPAPEGDLPHWMVRNASSVMLIGTDATNALGRQKQHERPSSAHSGRLRTASSSHSQRPATATARQRLPVPGSEQPAAADACAQSSKYSQWSRPASASVSPSPSQRGIVSTAHKFLTSDAPERPVSREGGRLSRPSTAQSRLGATSRSNQDRNHGEKSSTTLNKSDRNGLAAEHSERMKKGYGMSLLIPAMLSTDDTQVRPTTTEKK